MHADRQRRVSERSQDWELAFGANRSGSSGPDFPGYGEAALKTKRARYFSWFHLRHNIRCRSLRLKFCFRIRIVHASSAH